MSYNTSHALYRKYDTTGYGLDMAQWIALVRSSLKAHDTHDTHDTPLPPSHRTSLIRDYSPPSMLQVAHVAMTRTAFETRDRERKGQIVFNFDQLLEFSATI